MTGSSGNSPALASESGAALDTMPRSLRASHPARCPLLPSDAVEVACAERAQVQGALLTVRHLLSGYKYLLCSFFGYSL